MSACHDSLTCCGRKQCSERKTKLRTVDLAREMVRWQHIIKKNLGWPLTVITMDPARWNSHGTCWVQACWDWAGLVRFQNPIWWQLSARRHNEELLPNEAAWWPIIKTNPPKVILGECIALTQLCNKVPIGYSGMPQIHPKLPITFNNYHPI